MALFSKELLEAVVLFEVKSGRSYRTVATGVLIGFQATRDKEGQHHTFIITNKHVFQDKGTIYVSVDIEGGKRKRINLPLLKNNDEPTWFSHRFKQVDMALLPVSMNFLRHGLGAAHKWIPESRFLYEKDYPEKGFSVGDGVFFVGFPLGLSGKLRNSPILRAGYLARADKELLKIAKSLIIDGQNFPGNSGGPVFTKPDIAHLGDTKSIDSNFLVGIVKSYLPHTNYFVDPDNPMVSVSSTENSGLALYVPMDYARQIYNAWVRAGKPTYVTAGIT